MKKFIAKILVLVLLVCSVFCVFTACTENPDAGPPTDSSQPTGDGKQPGNENPGDEQPGDDDPGDDDPGEEEKGIWTPPVKQD